jgi:hypothetical protein
VAERLLRIAGDSTAFTSSWLGVRGQQTALALWFSLGRLLVQGLPAATCGARLVGMGRTGGVGLAECSEEGADVVDQQVAGFHGGEVAAMVEL